MINYICEYCGLIIKSNDLYLTHISETHDKNPKENFLPLKCNGCGVNHSLEKLMKRHEELSDEDWKFYDCECGYEYELGSYLKNYLHKIVFHEP